MIHCLNTDERSAAMLTNTVLENGEGEKERGRGAGGRESLGDQSLPVGVFFVIHLAETRAHSAGYMRCPSQHRQPEARASV